MSAPSKSADTITVVREYHAAYNAVMEPDKYVACTQYFIRRWMPLLGGTGTQIVLALRSLGYYNPKTGERREGVEVDLPTLAKLVGVDGDTISRQFGPKIVKGKRVYGEMQNPTLHLFVRREQQYRNDPVTGQLLRTINVYRIKMDDPLHDADLPRLQEELARQDKPQSSKPHNAEYEYPQAMQRKPHNTVNTPNNADSLPKNAVSVPKNADSKPQNAVTLKDYSYSPKSQKTIITTEESDRQKIDGGEEKEPEQIPPSAVPSASLQAARVVKTEGGEQAVKTTLRPWSTLTVEERDPWRQRAAVTEDALALQAETAFEVWERVKSRAIDPLAKRLYEAEKVGAK